MHMCGSLCDVLLRLSAHRAAFACAYTLQLSAVYGTGPCSTAALAGGAVRGRRVPTGEVMPGVLCLSRAGGLRRISRGSWRHQRMASPSRGKVRPDPLPSASHLLDYANFP